MDPAKRVQKKSGKKVTPTELAVANALIEIEKNSADVRSEISKLNIHTAREIKLKNHKRALIVVVPSAQIGLARKIQARLIRELEKKFSGKHVIILGQREVVKPGSNNIGKKSFKRPISKTITKVHEAILEDLVYPTDITGKRIRYRLDNTKIYKIFLDRKDQQNVEYKFSTFAQVYKILTGKDAVFLFPKVPAAKHYSFTQKQKALSKIVNRITVRKHKVQKIKKTIKAKREALKAQKLIVKDAAQKAALKASKKAARKASKKASKLAKKEAVAKKAAKKVAAPAKKAAAPKKAAVAKKAIKKAAPAKKVAASKKAAQGAKKAAPGVKRAAPGAKRAVPAKKAGAQKGNKAASARKTVKA